MSDFVTISRQQATSILIEIAELRSQVTDLTRNRDYFREQRDEAEKRYQDMNAEREGCIEEIISLKGEIEGLKAQLEAHGVDVE